MSEKSTTEDETDGAEQPAETATGATDSHDQTLGDDLPTLHQQLIAAPGIEIETNAARVDDQWAKSLFVMDYPETALTGMLDKALSIPDIAFDYSIHIHPRDSTRTLSALEESIRNLEVKRARKSESGDVTQIETQKTLDEHTAIYEQLLEGAQQVFDVGLYVTVRAETEKAVEQAADRLRSELQNAQLTPATAAYRQRDGLVATSPIGRDRLNQTVTMLGGAVGCLFPFSMGTHIDDDGVLVGYHSFTGSPVVVDRFEREIGYNCLVMGNTGAGKTFHTMLNLLRRLGKDQETVVIMADPFGDLGGLTEILDGERITVSGSQALNPLEISPTPQRILAANPDLDPYKKTVQKDALGFLEAFFEMEGMEMEGKRGLLSIALHEAYRRQGITPDPSTHDNPSPTLRDVRGILQEIIDSPAAFIDSAPESVSDVEVQLWQRRASQLRMDLAPFREHGEYEHLGRQTEVDLQAADVLYLDMQQLEGGDKTGVMLQLLLHAVYERAKETDKRVIFAIDEAHYLMQTGANLAFLERAVRHARHYDLSLQFITQTADEFFGDDYEQAAKVIADNCAVKIFHQVEGLSDANAAEWLGLSPPEAAFIRNAQPGSEEYGYSQALVEIGDVGRLPVNVEALPEEHELLTSASRSDGVPDTTTAPQSQQAANRDTTTAPAPSEDSTPASVVGQGTSSEQSREATTLDDALSDVQPEAASRWFTETEGSNGDGKESKSLQDTHDNEKEGTDGGPE